MRIVAFLVLSTALTLGIGLLPTSALQPPPGLLKDSQAVETFKQFRGLMNEGRYDIAALVLQSFLAANPTDDDFLTLESRYGTTVFQNLRNVPKWSDDAKLDKEARQTVETLITRSRAATDRQLRNQPRVEKFIRNLGATYEERIFAENELRKTGDFAVPFMVEALRVNADRLVSTGLLLAIPKMEPETMGGWLAALDGFSPEQRFQVLSAITNRPDAVDIQTSAQTDFVPALWRVMVLTEGQIPEPPARAFARSALTILGEKPDRTDPRAALVAIARTFYDRRAKFLNVKTNPDGSPSTVPVWIWDTAAMKLTRFEDVPIGQAEEHFGLLYARWALEKDIGYQPAQMLILSLSAERAMERGKFGELAKTDPAAYQLLASAPSDVLQEALEQALQEKRTALVLALTQALGDRDDKGAAGPRPGPPARPAARPPLLVRTLEYPDPRVQLAAAIALLRSPIPVDPAVKGRIIDILRRAAAADPGVPGAARGQALIADPNRQRADGTAVILRTLGYDVEILPTGRDLFRRVARSSDFDMILVDQHIVNPELQDVVAHLHADLNAGQRPVLVIASTDKPRPPSFDILVFRLALLIAATESTPVGMPAPFVPRLDIPVEIQATERQSLIARRDSIFQTTAQARIGRLTRVIESSGLQLTEAQQFLFGLRAEQITLAILAAEYPMSPESSPQTYAQVVALNRQLAAQPPVGPYRGIGLDGLMTRVERLEVDVARAPHAQKLYDDLRARVNPETLGLVIQSTRDTAIEARVARQVRGFPRVKVIPEPYSRIGFEDDIRSVFANDPAAAPRDPAEKKAAARESVEWLRRLAVGEVPGFDARKAEPELRAALRVDDLAEPAIEAVSRFGSAETQQDLLSVALNPTRPLPIRVKAANATIRHIQVNGKAIPSSMMESLAMQSGSEPDAILRGKLLVIKGLLATSPLDYAATLRNYNPPLAPVAPKEPAPPMPKAGDMEKKD